MLSRYPITEQSRERDLPVPVGDSSKALLLDFSVLITLLIKANCVPYGLKGNCTEIPDSLYSPPVIDFCFEVEEEEADAFLELIRDFFSQLPVIEVAEEVLCAFSWPLLSCFRGFHVCCVRLNPSLLGDSSRISTEVELDWLARARNWARSSPLGAAAT
jgi:hypothetical protein